MLIERIKSVDFNGEERVEDLYFNITRAELHKLNLYTEGGLLEYLKRIIQSRNQIEIASYFEKIVDLAYGIKSEDGKRFIKSPELIEEFKQTSAYDVFFTKLVEDAEYAAKFINGILPKDMSEGAQNMSEADKKKFEDEFGIKLGDANVENKDSSKSTI